jgi:hypothetical protein
VFDVRKASGGGSLKSWLTGASFGGASFNGARRGTVWHVEARLRRASDPSAASDWSPDALITAG